MVFIFNPWFLRFKWSLFISIETKRNVCIVRRSQWAIQNSNHLLAKATSYHQVPLRRYWMCAYILKYPHWSNSRYWKDLSDYYFLCVITIVVDLNNSQKIWLTKYYCTESSVNEDQLSDTRSDERVEVELYLSRNYGDCYMRPVIANCNSNRQTTAMCNLCVRINHQVSTQTSASEEWCRDCFHQIFNSTTSLFCQEAIEPLLQNEPFSVMHFAAYIHLSWDSTYEK